MTKPHFPLSDPFAPPFVQTFGAGSLPQSPNGTVIKAGSSAPIVDAAGNVWTIAAPIMVGRVAVDGDTQMSTNNIVEMRYVNGEIWILNTNGTWQGKKTPSAPWLPVTGLTRAPS